jgi:hypothetical protein
LTDNSIRVSLHQIQSSLRDEPFSPYPNPWVETHGYHRMSLRDKDGTTGNRCSATKCHRTDRATLVVDAT